MEVKGTSVKGTEQFVKEKYPNRYEEWLSTLPAESKKIFQDGILAGNWYSFYYATVLPTQKICELFYNGNVEKGAFDVGYASASYALKGVYKVFIKIASVDFVLKRVSSIFTTYYSTGRFEIVEQQSNLVFFNILGFEKQDEIIFPRMAGWVKGIFEMVSGNKYNVEYRVKDLGNNKVEGNMKVFWN